MLRNIVFIARRDLRSMLRAKETLIWVFLMPIVFFFFIGSATKGMGPDPERKDYPAYRVRGDDFLTKQLALRLEERGYTVFEPESETQFDDASRSLSLPAAFADSILAGSPVAIQYRNTREGMDREYDSIRIKRAVYTLLADIVVAAEQGDSLTAASVAALNAQPRSLTLSVESAGRRIEPPTGFDQAVPGIMVMFTLLVMATSGAILLVIERQEGLVKRLAYAPMSRLTIVLGKWSGKWVLGLVQIAFAMITGTLLFKVGWGPDLGMLLLLLFAYGALCASIGILLGSLARTERQAAGIGVISANLLGALGGCWWPIEVAPAWAQKLQLFLPTGWAMDALHKLVSFQSGAASVLPHFIGMCFGTLILLFMTARVFRFD